MPCGQGLGGGGELPDKGPEARGHLQALGSESLGGRWAESTEMAWRRKWLQPASQEIALDPEGLGEP